MAALTAYDLPTATPLSEGQKEMVRIIFEEFRAAGFHRGVAVAAVANAYAESGFNPNAVGDSGKSVGLFQLHEAGVGSGMSVEARRDPHTNARTMANWGLREPRFMAVAQDPDATLRDLTYAFTVYLERPANAHGHGLSRAAWAERNYPEVATVSGRALASWSGSGASSLGPTLALASAALALTFVWVYQDKIRKRLGV